MITSGELGDGIHPNLIARLWRQTGVLRAGAIAGALGGLVAGGVGGRIVMRIVALVDESADGARTDFATVGDITLGGTFTLMVLTTIAGVLGGVLYVGARRWLPWTGVRRAFVVGFFILGPSIVIFNEDSPDLQIFEPILPILAMFLALVVGYGVVVALIADRLYPEPEKHRGAVVDPAVRVLICAYAVALCAIEVAETRLINDKAGTCLSSDRNGGCGVRTPD